MELSEFEPVWIGLTEVKMLRGKNSAGHDLDEGARPRRSDGMFLCRHEKPGSGRSRLEVCPCRFPSVSARETQPAEAPTCPRSASEPAEESDRSASLPPMARASSPSHLQTPWRRGRSRSLSHWAGSLDALNTLTRTSVPWPDHARRRTTRRPSGRRSEIRIDLMSQSELQTRREL